MQVSRLLERLEDFIAWGVTGAVGAAAGGVWWLIRQVFTNQKQIEMMREEFRHRDQLRQEDRDDLTEVKDSVKRIESVLLENRRR